MRECETQRCEILQQCFWLKCKGAQLTCEVTRISPHFKATQSPTANAGTCIAAETSLLVRIMFHGALTAEGKHRGRFKVASQVHPATLPSHFGLNPLYTREPALLQRHPFSSLPVSSVVCVSTERNLLVFCCSKYC